VHPCVVQTVQIIVLACTCRAPALLLSAHTRGGFKLLGIQPKHDWIFLMEGQTTTSNKEGVSSNDSLIE